MHPTLQAILSEVQQGEALLVDVREREEWEKGHLAGAHHLPLTTLEQGCCSGIPSCKKLYLYCRRANRVKQAMVILRRSHPSTELIPFGFEDLWAAGFPLSD